MKGTLLFSDLWRVFCGFVYWWNPKKRFFWNFIMFGLISTIHPLKSQNWGPHSSLPTRARWLRFPLMPMNEWNSIGSMLSYVCCAVSVPQCAQRLYMLRGKQSQIQKKKVTIGHKTFHRTKKKTPNLSWENGTLSCCCVLHYSKANATFSSPNSHKLHYHFWHNWAATWLSWEGKQAGV